MVGMARLGSATTSGSGSFCSRLYSFCSRIMQAFDAMAMADLQPSLPAGLFL